MKECEYGTARTTTQRLTDNFMKHTMIQSFSNGDSVGKTGFKFWSHSLSCTLHRYKI